MKTLFKNIGLIILFTGVIIVAYTSWDIVTENTGLWVGGVLIIVGLLAYIMINKRLQ